MEYISITNDYDFNYYYDCLPNDTTNNI